MRFGARVRAAVVSDTGARLTSYVVGLLAWQIIGALYERVPGPIEVVQFLADEFASGDVWPNFYATADRFLWGLAIAIVAGVLFGLVIGMWPLARALLKDTMMVGLAIPAIIWALLTALWFGFAWKAPVLTVALTATPFVAVNVAQGVEATPRDLVRMSKAFGVPLQRRVRGLVLPSAVPLGGRAVPIYEEVHPLRRYNSPRAHRHFLEHLRAVVPATCSPIL